jgi:hypothetical protein
MATYKVIQDIEAEDKLLGPLTIRQFVYAGITGVCVYLGYFVIAKGLPILVIALIPPALVSAFFAFPWSKEQPTELWALARISFLFKPRLRIWNQSGIKELVTVTAPRRIEQVYTDGLTQSEVKSRLQALANTIDSRGWAVKGGYPYMQNNSDRLISVQFQTQGASANDTFPDMLDPGNSSVARKFDSMLHTNAQQRREQLVSSMQLPDPAAPEPSQQTSQQTATPPADYWFMNQGASATNAQVVLPGTTDDPYVHPADISSEEEQALVAELKSHDTVQAKEYSHLPTILPLAEQEKIAKQQALLQATAATPKLDDDSTASPMTDQHDAAILELARNDDLNVDTIARQAKKARGGDDNEVVISLH